MRGLEQFYAVQSSSCQSQFLTVTFGQNGFQKKPVFQTAVIKHFDLLLLDRTRPIAGNYSDTVKYFIIFFLFFNVAYTFSSVFREFVSSLSFFDILKHSEGITNQYSITFSLHLYLYVQSGAKK